jgi:hypothetical protein
MDEDLRYALWFYGFESSSFFQEYADEFMYKWYFDSCSEEDSKVAAVEEDIFRELIKYSFWAGVEFPDESEVDATPCQPSSPSCPGVQASPQMLSESDNVSPSFVFDVCTSSPHALTIGQPPFLLNSSFCDDLSKASVMMRDPSTGLGQLQSFESFEFAAGSLALSFLLQKLSYCNGIHLVPLHVQSGVWPIGIPPVAAPPWLQSALVSHIPCCIWSLPGFDGFSPSLPVFSHGQPPFLLNSSFCDDLSKASVMTHSLVPDVDHLQSREFAAGSLALSFLLQKLSYCNGIHLVSLHVQSGVWPIGIPPVAAPPWRKLGHTNKLGWQGTPRQVTPCKRRRRAPPDDGGPPCTSRKAVGPSRGYG